MEEDLIERISLTVFFICITLCLGALLKEFTKKVPIPYSAAVFLTGIIAGTYLSHIDLHMIRRTVKLMADIDATALMDVLIPSLVFYNAFTVDTYILKKQISQILILSIPSLIISASLIAVSIKLLFQYPEDYYNWGFAVVFGSIVSCTDTSEVVRLLKEADAPKKFITLVQSESLFNNGYSYPY